MQNLRSIAYGGGLFVTVGDATNGSTVLVSSNGLEWMDRSSGTGLSSWRKFSSVAYSQDRFVAGGWYAGLRQSLDGGSTFSHISAPEHDLTAFAHGNGVRLAAGVDRANSSVDRTLISIDGTGWFPLPTGTVPDRNAAVFFQDTFITVGQGGSIRQSARFTDPAAGGFAAWREAQFPGSPPDSAAHEDFDRDRIPNLAEYAAGTDPADHTSRPTMTASMENGMLTLRFSKAAAANDVIIRAQRSTDLLAWRDDGIVTVRDDADEIRVLLQMAPGEVPSRRMFARWIFEIR